MGRDLHGYLRSRKLARIVPPALWKNVFKRLLAADYRRGVADQRKPDAIGVSLVLKAVRS